MPRGKKPDGELSKAPVDDNFTEELLSADLRELMSEEAPKEKKETTAPTQTEQPGQEQPPESKQPAEPEKHPQFQKRINQLRAQIEAERQRREQSEQALQALYKHYTELTEVVDGIEEKVSSADIPDPVENPAAYAKYLEDRLLKKITKTTPPSFETMMPKETAAKTMPTPNQIPPQEAVQAALHDDYYEVIEEVNNDIATDAALRNAIYSQPDPYKAAYEYGTRKRQLSLQLKQRKMNQAYAEGGAPTVETKTQQELLPEERKLLRLLQASGQNITEEQYLKRTQLIAKRKERGLHYDKQNTKNTKRAVKSQK